MAVLHWADRESLQQPPYAGYTLAPALCTAEPCLTVSLPCDSFQGQAIAPRWTERALVPQCHIRHMKAILLPLLKAFVVLAQRTAPSPPPYICILQSNGCFSVALIAELVQ